MRNITNDINENKTGRTTSDIAIDERVEILEREGGRGENRRRREGGGREGEGE